MRVYIDRDELEDFAMNCVGGVVTIKQIHEFPGVHVPPHGRPIDADELNHLMYHQAFETDTNMQIWNSGCWIRYKMFEKTIETIPTIIPPDRR